MKDKMIMTSDTKKVFDLACQAEPLLSTTDVTVEIKGIKLNFKLNNN